MWRYWCSFKDRGSKEAERLILVRSSGAFDEPTYMYALMNTVSVVRSFSSFTASHLDRA